MLNIFSKFKLPRKRKVISGKGLRLNIGCSKHIREGYVNIDIRSLSGVDVVTDIRNLNYSNVDEILAIDVIEHFPQGEVEEILKRWIKCLRKGGILILECPDVRELARMNLPDREFIKRLYGGQDYPENFHYAGFTMQTMKELLIKCGLKIESCSHIVGNLHIKAQK